MLQKEVPTKLPKQNGGEINTKDIAIYVAFSDNGTLVLGCY